MKNALELLNKYFGYKDFRKNQEIVISTIINKEDTVAIMPTGAGKSICYQIPALLFSGLTIVISPLISLMKDQVDSLLSVGIKAAYINSTLDKYQFDEVIYGIKNNEYKLLYIAPERLESNEFLNAINNIEISQIAVDEAHCLSQWGHDFRMSYRRIPWFIERLSKRPIITAFTATASAEVRTDIINLLKLNNPKVHVGGFDRENLEITIIKEGDKRRYLFDYLEANKDVCGIIYCATRKEVDELYNKLKESNYLVSRYHAGLSDEERRSSQDDFINDNTNIMVATNAFGMGIDKSNIRYVIHNNMPQTIENYYQEIGRAGRDGEKSECILLFTPGDIHLQKYLIENSLSSEDRKQIAYSKLQDMTSLVYSTECYRKVILNYFGEELLEDCNNCSNCLSEGDTVDKTIDAQKVLSCIYRMNRGFGTTMVVDVLRGSKNSKVLSFNFDKLTTYGIMKDYKKDELVRFINTLISHGFIDVVGGTYPILKLNNTSIDIIKGNKKVLFKEAKKAKAKYEVSTLFNELKELRHKLAKEENVPPYVVFGDNTLREMSKKYPVNEEEMLKITGVGEVKYQRYGDKFIKLILDYVKENNINKEDKEKLDNNFYVYTDNELYQRLRILREEFAKKENKYPSSLIHCDSLKEISGRYPKSLEELNDISGMGPAKLNRYGESIIALVKEYINEKDIKKEWKYRGKDNLVLDNETRSHYEIAIDKLEEGYKIEEISEEIEISISTILGYCTEYIKEGNIFKCNLDISKYYNIPEKDLIIKVAKETGLDKVSAIKKLLPREIKYENIRAVILNNFYNIV